VALPALSRAIDDTGYHYAHVDVIIDRKSRNATLVVSAPKAAPPAGLDGILAAGAAWWPLAMARELDDAILLLRTNDPEIGTWILKTRGNIENVLATDATLKAHAANWFVRETVGVLRRTFARLDVSSRTLFAVIDQQSCFAGTLMELALAADRGYMLALPAEDPGAPRIALSEMNFGSLPMINRLPRILTRFCEEAIPVETARARIGQKLDAETALDLGLVTYAPDDLDWGDEIRIALEERASLSPDALTGLEANLRFTGTETMETRIFARLSAWQNWIFNRPNATGVQGALKVYGTGAKAQFNRERV
jgi:benzoyl-CoA-dihydrodiol lyase